MSKGGLPRQDHSCIGSVSAGQGSVLLDVRGLPLGSTSGSQVEGGECISSCHRALSEFITSLMLSRLTSPGDERNR